MANAFDASPLLSSNRRRKARKPTAQQIKRRRMLRFRSARLELLEHRHLLSVGGLPLVSNVGEASPEYDVQLRPDTNAALELTDVSSWGISGKLFVPGVNLSDVSVNDWEFTRLDIPGWSLEGQFGQAELPVFRATLALPNNVEVLPEYEVVDQLMLETEQLIYPNQPPVPGLAAEGGGPVEPDFEFDAVYYSGWGGQMTDLFAVSEPLVAGDHHSIAIEFSPFQYHPSSGEITVVTELSFDLLFQEQLFGGFGFNMGDFAPSAGDADYIVITADAFYEEVLPLAEWKHKKGFKTYVAKVSEVGATDTAIYNFIKNAYDADTDKPEYVLLVGDHENVPSYKITGHPYYGSDHVWHTDYEYAKLAGSDNRADLAVGRLPGDTETQITTMVNKTLTYERSPDTGSWYDDVMFAGMFQDNGKDHIADRWFMEDLHRASDFMSGDYDFWSGSDPYDQGYTVHTKRVWDSGTSDELHYKSSSYPGRITPPDPVPDVWKDKPDEGISSTINSGVSIVFHRDHGYYGGWGDPRYRTSNVNALTNGNKLPITLSLNCETGWFDSRDAFGEAWMRNANGGAVAYTGGVRVSYSGLNDALHVGIFDAMWNDYDSNWQSTNYANSWHFGDVMNYAKDRVFGGYGHSSTYAILTSRLFNVFGDPELMLRTEVPQTLYVTHPSNVEAGTSADFTVTVKWNNASGAAVPGALVAISRGDSSDYWVGTTNAAGEVTFSGLTTSEAGAYDLVVSEQNADPYEGTVSSDNPPQDFGDAPNSYSTLLASNGPRHKLVAGAPILGASIDAEPDGQPNSDATGDGADEDGVTFTSPLYQGGTTTVSIVASAAGLLNAWVDFNDDGDWSDAGEQIFVDTSLAAGTNNKSFPVPVGAKLTSQTFARFRLSQQSGLSTTGMASDGEVEDYAVAIANAAPTDLILTPSSINENTDTNGGNVQIGTLTPVDIDSGDTYTYTLVAGTGDADNATFVIVGDKLLVKKDTVLDFEVKPGYSVRVNVNDGHNDFAKPLTVTVNNLPEVENVQIGDGSASRSMVTRVVVLFDQVMTLDAGVFAVSRRGSGGGAVDVAFTTNDAGGKTVATLTFSGTFVDTSGSLQDGNYDLTIDATKARDSNSTQLDGDRNGAAGGNCLFGTKEADAFFRMFGDVDGTRNVDFLDLFYLRKTFGKSTGDDDFDPRFDWDSSGNIDFLDLFYFRVRFGTRLDFE